MGFTNRFARSAGESAYPHLWSGLVAAYSPRMGPQGLVTTRDFAGKHNHATLTNSPVERVGQYGMGLHFTAASSMYARADATRLSTHGTITAWARIDSEDIFNISSYVNSTRSETDKGLGMYYDGGPNFVPSCFIYDGTTKRASGTTNFLGGAYPRSGLWGMTWDSVNLRLYFNGVNEGTTAAGASFDSYSSGPFFDIGWGNGSGSSGSHWHGMIWEVLVWNRPLNPAEHMDLWLGASPLTAKRRRRGQPQADAGVFAPYYWLFDQDSNSNV